MTKSSKVFKVGSRSSKLAIQQSNNALDKIKKLLSSQKFEFITYSSAGDKDRSIDLRHSPANFFTNQLDQAVLNGEIDCAIHSAKDVPNPLPKGLDWFWLPWSAEPRDAIILPNGKTMDDLPTSPRIGISSERRAKYCQTNFPTCKQATIRGNIDERLAQLDDGKFDLIIMAAAALDRLNLSHRISNLIPLQDLPVPEGQGYLCLTFRNDDNRFHALRQLLINPLTMAGAGVGNIGNCTHATIQAIKHCDICFYDSLLAEQLLDFLPPNAQAIYVGKRSGTHSHEQNDISQKILDASRKGYKVVRLKGGDPAIFGRLAEEIDLLEKFAIPFKVLPGLSTLNVAAANSGILLTRRGVSRGFTVMTPREAGGKVASVGCEVRNALPQVYYMSIKSSSQVCKQLITDGRSAKEPAAVIFGAGSDQQFIIRSTLDTIAQKVENNPTKLPGLLVIGEVTKFSFNQNLPLNGAKVILTCSQSLQEKAICEVRKYGGCPISMPMIETQINQNAIAEISQLNRYDWLVITSPSAIRIFMNALQNNNLDNRSIPQIMVCGKGSKDEFAKYGIFADSAPQFDFNAQAILECANSTISPNSRILRLRSDKAGDNLAKKLRNLNFEVTDSILYKNTIVKQKSLPPFEMILFASASAVENFIAQHGKETLDSKVISCIGIPTADKLKEYNLQPTVLGYEATIHGAIASLAANCIKKKLDNNEK